MKSDDDINKIAKQAIQEVTGTPATQLRGLTPQHNLEDFVARRLSQVVEKPAIAPTEAKVSSIVFPPISAKTNEQPLGGIGGGQPAEDPATPTDNVEFTISGASYTGSVVITNLTPT